MPPLATGVGAVRCSPWLVIVGGVRSIGRAAETLAPAKVILYLAGGAAGDRAARRASCPPCSALVLGEAFSLRATAGGTLGA